MRLSECLNSSDIDTLRRIAEAYRFDCSKSSKNALMQEIITHFRNRQFIAGALEEMPDAAFREAVSQLMLDNRQEFSREEVLALLRRAGRMEDGADLKWMARMMNEGWLFRLNSKGGRQFYFIPEDLRRTIRDYLSVNLQSRVEVAEGTPIVYRDENLALVRDTAAFLQYVRSHDVRITKDGTILKRTQQEILSLLEIKEEALGKVSWRFGYGRRFHEYPDRFALIYDYCYHCGLIVETAEGSLQTGDKLGDSLKRGEKERLEDVFRYWRLLYRRPIPQLKLCIATLAQAAKDGWVLVDSMNQLLSAYVQDYYFDKVPALIEQRICNMLVHLGLLAHGQLADGTAVIKVTALGRELLLEEEGAVVEETVEAAEEGRIVPIIVQPNFDVLVPVETYDRIAWELEEVTDLIRVDTMRIHRLTKSSVMRAFDLGWTAETVHEFLHDGTGGIVPGNVERMIQQWESEYSREFH